MLSDSVEAIFARAKKVGRELGVDYAGAMTPAEAEVLRAQGEAVVVDVRTQPEWVFVGRVPDAIAVEWQSFPDMTVNPNFVAQLRESVAIDVPVLMLCRSGARSHLAAGAAAAAGFRAYNVLEGFEGDLDAARQRGNVNGWRVRGLPWVQS